MSIVEERIFCPSTGEIGLLRSYTVIRMQLSFRKRNRLSVPQPSTLLELNPGEEAILDRLDLPDEIARRLMELGFLPGQRISLGGAAPGGDPRVYRIDGSEVALRLETAARLHLRAGASLPENNCR